MSQSRTAKLAPGVSEVFTFLVGRMSSLTCCLFVSSNLPLVPFMVLLHLLSELVTLVVLVAVRLMWLSRHWTQGPWTAAYIGGQMLGRQQALKRNVQWVETHITKSHCIIRLRHQYSWTSINGTNYFGYLRQSKCSNVDSEWWWFSFNVVASDQSQLQITQSQKSQNIVVDADGLGYKMKLVGPTAKSTNMECSDFDFSVIFLRRTTWPSRSTEEWDLDSSFATLIKND